ncbi:hypothetical protein SFRURICE_006999 [Spodoptera frugiperda]|nr:hypothetical protein SFRURICE_006999 [Spodoptera frugiperda]
MSCIETHATASTDPHRTDRINSNAYMRCMLMTSYGMPLQAEGLFIFKLRSLSAKQGGAHAAHDEESQCDSKLVQLFTINLHE